MRNPAINILWNCAGVGVDALTAVLITPLLFRGLGDTTYSLWILIGSVTGCFGILDLGMRGAVGRFVAFHHAKGDRLAVQRVLSTAAVALCGVAVISLVLTFMVALAFPRVYTIPAEQVSSVQQATLIVGVQLALFFVLRMFDAVLWGYQRFDLLNLIDIPTALIRAGLIAWLIAGGGTLVTLAWISFGTVAGSGLAKGWCTYTTTPGLRIRASNATRIVFYELVAYGCWNFIISVAGMARSQFSPLLVGSLVGLTAVGPFSIVLRLPAMATTILSAAAGVFTPVAVTIHAHDDNFQRHRLLIEGTRLSLSLALYFAALFFWLGRPLLSIWIKPEFAEHWPLLVIIGCGEVLPMAMSVATGMILAMARHRTLACLAIAETLTVICVAPIAGAASGLVGIVVALALVAVLFRGICVALYICRLTSIRPSRFFVQAIVGPIVCAAAACVPLHCLVASRPPTNWPFLFAYTAMFSAIYLAVVALGVLERTRGTGIVGRLRATATQKNIRPTAVVLAADLNGLGVVRALHRQGVQTIAIVRSRDDAVFYSRLPRQTLVLDQEASWGNELVTRLMQLECGDAPVLIPTSDVFLEFMLAHRDRLQMKFRHSLPNSQLLATLLDKRAETQRLDAAGIPLPNTVTDLHLCPNEWFSTLTFPLIVKPRMSKWTQLLGAKNRILNTPAEARQFATQFIDVLEYFLAQEIIPGDDDQQWVCHCVMSHSFQMLSCFTFKRLSLSPAHYGVTASAISEYNHEIQQLAQKIGLELQYSGPAMIEFKRDARDGHFKYLETNPRLGMCNWFDTCCGVENAFNAYRLACSEVVKPSPQNQRDGRVFISLFDDLYSRYKDGETLLTSLKCYAGFLTRRKVGAYWCWSDPGPSLMMLVFQARAVVHSALGKCQRACRAAVMNVDCRKH